MTTEPTTEPTIGPCPVCGAHAELCDDSEAYEAPTLYVFCTAGGCLLGPNRPTAAEAIAIWSRLGQNESLRKKTDAPTTNDERAFGRDAWVYCSQHMKPHQTGWCTVAVRDKIGLGVTTAQEAEQKCRDFKLPLYADRTQTQNA